MSRSMVVVAVAAGGCATAGEGPDPDVTARIEALEARVDEQAAALADAEARIAALESAGFLTAETVGDVAGTVPGLADFVTVSGTDVVITGANVRVVSGAGATDAEPNGLGNVIVGYDEGEGTEDRAGSHNLVVGSYHQYGSYGGIVVGTANTIAGPFSSVSGGRQTPLPARTPPCPAAGEGVRPGPARR